jgi:TetR/AcrR family transcriptional regulator, cholesterol catabolism regulator
MAKHSTRPSNAPPRVAPDVASMRRDQRERRDRIVRAAVRLMVDVDYHKIQVRDVADEAGVALGTLYRYFTSKDHLFACALVEWASGFRSRIDKAAPTSTLDRVKEVYRLAARAFEREPRVFDVIIQLAGSREPDTTAEFTAFSRSTTAAFASALADIPPDDRDDIVAVMSAVLSESLRSWQHGILTLPDVYRRIARAAELILT